MGAWYHDDTTLQLDMVYAMTSHRYQAVTRRSQLSPPMIDVVVSSEVTDCSLSKVSSEKSWLSTADSDDADAIRQVHPPMSGSPALSRERNDNNRGHQLGQPLPVGHSKFDISPGHLRRLKLAAYGMSLACVVGKWSVRALGLDWTSNYWCGIDFLLSCGWPTTPERKTRWPSDSAVGNGRSSALGVVAALDTAHPTQRYRYHHVASRT